MTQRNPARLKVSVIIAVRNESAMIERSIRAVLAQDYPTDAMEVILADGMSTDRTKEIVTATAGPAVKVIDNPGVVVPAGLNAALREATGDVIVRLDGHCLIPPDYVRACVDALERTGADNVGGPLRAVGEGFLGRAIATAITTPFGTGNASYRHEGRSGWVETVFPGAFRREVFDRIGGFDEELVRAQDGEFNFRLVQSGGRIWLDPSIRVTYFGRSSLRGLWRQYYQYGVYKVRLMQKRGGLPAPRQLVPPLFVLGVVASLAAAGLTRDPRWLGVVTGPYVLASVITSIAAGRNEPGEMIVLPALFATMHVAWGLGFIIGIWRWRRSFMRRSN